AEQMGCTIRFGMNTNGLSLTDDVLNFLISHKVGIAISMDGSERQHNRYRLLKGGRPSYNILRPKVEKFIAAYGSVSKILTVRITSFDPTFDFVEAVKSVRAIGFNNVGLGIAIGAMLNTTTVENRHLLVEKVLKELTRLKKYCLDEYKDGHLFRVSIFNDTMFSLYSYSPKFTPCGAQRVYAGVSPNGDIVPCHRYIGTQDTARKAGSVLNNSANDLTPEFRSQKIIPMKFQTVEMDSRTDEYSCKTCWARHLCGGECYEIRDVMGDGFSENKPFMCDLKRGIFELGIELFSDIVDKPQFKQLIEMNASIKPTDRELISQ
ncbi:MAG: hypothetical protein C0490_14670, partial [Marivirga sp.]|nr:hypothetical protein [Marivirga sp.]